MGKKNKKFGKFFFSDITLEDQKKESEKLRRMMDGENIFKKSCEENDRGFEPKNRSGLSSELERVIRDDFHRSKKDKREEAEEREDEVETKGIWSNIGIDDEEEVVSSVSEKPVATVPVSSVNRVGIKMIPALLKVSCYDGVTDSPVSLELVISSHIFPDRFDNDLVGTIKSYLFTKILCNKYPAAIYTTEEFRDPKYPFRFVKADEYDNAKFFFSTNDDYVFAYYVDMDSMLKFEDFMDTMSWDEVQQLKAWLALAVSTSNGNSVFPCLDEEDESSLSLMYCSKEWNQKEAFAKLFMNDEKTILSSKPVRPDEGVAITDVEIIRKIVEHLGVWISDPDIESPEIKGKCLTKEIMSDIEVMDEWLVENISDGYYYSDNDDDDEESLFGDIDPKTLLVKKVPGTSVPMPVPVVKPSTDKTEEVELPVSNVKTSEPRPASNPIAVKPAPDPTVTPDNAVETISNVLQQAVKETAPIKQMSKSDREVEEELSNFVLNVVRNNRN